MDASQNGSRAFLREETKGRNRTIPSNNTIEPRQSYQSEYEESVNTENVLTLYLSPNDLFTPPIDPKSDTNLASKCPLINLSCYSAALPDFRAATAPARPKTELQRFKSSAAFIVLEAAAIYAGQLVQKRDGKFDLEAAEGQKQCKKLLEQIEGLTECFKARIGSRSYRNKFSQAYKVLYKEGTLGYLIEILDSAQERMWELEK